MLVGVPASGKSTWVKQFFAEAHPDWIVISSDDWIEHLGLKSGLTYSQAFSRYVKFAEQLMQDDLRYALDGNLNIIWDQTNVSAKSRAKKLALVPKQYVKEAVHFATPDEDELVRRMKARPGKNIPAHVLASMKASLQVPSFDEGFKRIQTVQPSCSTTLAVTLFKRNL
jgi:predicted kinase